MKKSTLLFILIFLFAICLQEGIAQEKGRKDGVFFKVLLIDYESPATGAIPDFLDDYTSGFEFGYARQLGSKWKFILPVKFGKARFFNDDRTVNRKTDFWGLDGLFAFEPLHGKPFFSPYGYIGVGGLFENDNGGAQLPFGAGLNMNFDKNFAMQLSAEFRTGLSNNYTGWNMGLGFVYTFGEDAPPPPDTDGDGIIDENDDCPTVAGLEIFKGCPDTDGDGIMDSKDDCPKEAGMAEFNGCPDKDEDGLPDNKDDCPEDAGPIDNKGCPILDADGDGVLDENDDCPNEAGPVATKGCPDGDGDGFIDSKDDCPEIAGTLNGCPDSDGDGIVNSSDRCPNKAGPASNNGCPEVKEEVVETLNFVAQAVRFETGKAVLKPESPAILDKVVDIMKQYPNYNLSINGHTDSIGSASTNQVLSENRAKSCFEYLKSKGVDASRMSWVGYGETRPIADNTYKDGREQNRRVEFDLFLK